MPEAAPTALIAEDEPLLAAGLQAELAALWPALHMAAVVGDGASAVERALALRPQVCFLDIRMPGMTGLEAAQALAEDWPDGEPFPLIVFVTAYDQYAVQAFEAQAVDYLVKPVQSARLDASLLRLRERLATRRAGAAPAETLDATWAQLRALLASAEPAARAPRLEVIQAQQGAVVHLVPVDEVIYFEAADKLVRVVTATRELLVRMSLRDLTVQLDPQRFWQVHRGTLVQARFIATARREDSGKVRLSLRGRPETLVASRLYAHLFRGM
jgi:DNA-binding LytR/AlgR family response regulator